MKRIAVALLALAATTGGTAAGIAAAGEPQFPPTAAFLARASLAGASVLPGPGDPDAVGQFGMNPRKRQGRVCYGMVVEGLDPITGVFIHKGRRREEGPRRLTLFEDPVGRPGEGYYAECTSGVRRRLIRRIFKPREGRPWYVQITTVAYPNGALRGQLGPGDYAIALPGAGDDR